MQGLTNREVEDRVREGLVNVEVDPSTRTVRQIVRSNVLTYFNLIFTVLAALLIAAGSFKDLSFMLIIFANTGIGIFQELRSKQTLDNLKFARMPRCRCVREGRETEVSTEELVLGDLVILSAGNQIPADATVVEGVVSVNESLLTGEADEIEKNPGDDLLSGSYIISGECKAHLTAVGRDSYISKLSMEATRQKKGDDKSQMVRSLDKLVMVIGVLIIPIGGILLYQQMMIQHLPFRESVIAMVAAILGMIPEGLYMMASIAMVVSAMRLARTEVLVQNMRCIETLARVDVLCVDKTGTITGNDMHVTEVRPMMRGINPAGLHALLSDLAASQNRDNITMAALQAYFDKPKGRKAERICPFSSAYKYCGVVYKEGNFVLGAPEYVLGSLLEEPAGKYAVADLLEERGGEGGLHEHRLETLADVIALISAEGNRVLALAQTEMEPDGSPIEGAVRLLALVSLANPIREGAQETFAYFANNGVEVKVISGDNPVTVSRVAQTAGIEGAERYVDARTLSTEEDVDKAMSQYTVFGRVSPEQKRQFVKSLQKQKKTVGMTGDGVNDILALRDADISIAMASGSEAAASASQLVLMDSDFSRMPLVVAEGRRVVNNIIKTATLYLTKNIFSLLLALFSVASVLQYPLKPSQITLISMFTIGIPSFLLSLEPNRRRIRGSFLGSVFKKAAPAGITLFLSVSALLVFGQVMELSADDVSTAASGLVALVEFMILARVAKPMNRVHVGMMVVMLAGFFYAILFHNNLFGISPLDWQSALLLVVFILATECLYRYFYRFTTFLERLAEKGFRRVRSHTEAGEGEPKKNFQKTKKSC